MNFKIISNIFLASIINDQLLPNLQKLSFEVLSRVDISPFFHNFSHTANVNIKRKKGAETIFVQNILNGNGGDLDVLVTLACDFTLKDVKELVDIFGADMLYQFLIINRLIYNKDQDLLKSKAIADYIFKYLLTPLNLNSIFTMTNPKSTAMLQYLIYIGEEYQGGMLIDDSRYTDVNMSDGVVSAAKYGWNVSTQIKHFLPLAILTTKAPSLFVSTLKYFHVDESTIESLVLKCCIKSKTEILNDLLFYLFSNKRDLLHRLLVKKVKRTAPSSKEFVVSVPIIAFLFDHCNSFLLVKIIENMDQQLFDSIGVNERGDTILHLFLHFKGPDDYNVLFALIKKSPNLVNCCNYHLLTPLHLCLYDCHSFVFDELSKYGGNFEMKDYMERSATQVAIDSSQNSSRHFVSELIKRKKSHP